MAQNLNSVFSEHGVHVGLITVGGIVSPEAKNLNPKSIAEKTYAFYETGAGLEVDIKD